MTRLLLGVLCAALLGFAAIAAAQEATERFIPMGQSPGLSGRSTLIGTVVAFDNGMLDISVPPNAATQRVRVTPATRIWLDRSAAKQPSVTGTAAELRAGRRIEVKRADAAPPAAADWIKIEAAVAP
jgi:hypothetical protein